MCIFCKIVEGAIPSYKLYEDDDVLVILDIQQATKGHCLVLLKKHVPTIFDLSTMDAKKVFSVAVRMAKKIRKTLGITALNMINNNGELAGQTIHHYHIHLVPRTSNDGFSIHFPANKLTPNEFLDLKEVITNNEN